MKKLDDIEDGYITGTLERKGGNCYRCGASTRVILVRSLKLPDEFFSPVEGSEDKVLSDSLKHSLIFLDKEGTQYDRIGIGCGCYAAGHRQIAHIRASIKHRAHLSRS